MNASEKIVESLKLEAVLFPEKERDINFLLRRVATNSNAANSNK